PLLSGGDQRGLQVWYDNLVLNGTGNAAFGDAALTVPSNDNMWRGPITLKSNIAVSFDVPASTLTGVAVGAITADSTNLLGGAVSVANVTTGGSGSNAVQALNFGAGIAGGTFTLTVSNAAGTVFHTTAPITWSSSLPTLVANILSALNAISSIFNGVGGVSIVDVALSTPVIDVFPNARLTVTGATVTTASPLVHDYELNNSYADALGGPALVPTGGSLTATQYTWANVPGANQGLTLTGGLPTVNNYSIQMVFDFTQVPPPTGAYNRILDFKARVAPLDRKSTRLN